MIKPQPYELCCKECGWSKTFAPQGDVMLRGQDGVSSCPRCGNNQLEHKTAGPVKGFLAELREQFNRR